VQYSAEHTPGLLKSGSLQSIVERSRVEGRGGWYHLEAGQSMGMLEEDWQDRGSNRWHSAGAGMK
jgi:hypothetical protein